MSDVKWIKIVTDIFDDEKMCAIESLPDGITIEVTWFKILCLAGKCNQNGFLSISNKIAYTEEMLSKIFRLDLAVVRRALDIFQTFGMIEVIDNTYMVSNWLQYQNQKGLEELKKNHAEAQKRYREKQKELKLEKKSDITVTSRSDIIDSISISYSSSIGNIVNYLNNKSNKNYRSNSNNTIKHIKARLNEGYTEEDFYRVIDWKCSQWLEDPKMSEYLRPDTLFGSKFESYLNSAPKKAEKKKEVYKPIVVEEETDDEWEERMRREDESAV